MFFVSCGIHRHVLQETGSFPAANPRIAYAISDSSSTPVQNSSSSNRWMFIIANFRFNPFILKIGCWGKGQSTTGMSSKLNKKSWLHLIAVCFRYLHLRITWIASLTQMNSCLTCPRCKPRHLSCCCIDHTVWDRTKDCLSFYLLDFWRVSSSAWTNLNFCWNTEHQLLWQMQAAIALYISS